jgi:hypothetical protein
MQSRLFPGFTHDDIFGRFVRVNRTTHDPPAFFVCVTNQQQPAFMIKHEGRDSRHQDECRAHATAELPEIIRDRHRPL